MNVNVSASRRSFLKGSAAAGLVIALRLPVSNAAAAAADAQSEFIPNAFLRIDRAGSHTATANEYIGYGDWDFPQGNLFPPDGSISHRDGSGAARIAQNSDADGTWRFKRKELVHDISGDMALKNNR